MVRKCQTVTIQLKASGQTSGKAEDGDDTAKAPGKTSGKAEDDDDAAKNLGKADGEAGSDKDHQDDAFVSPESRFRKLEGNGKLVFKPFKKNKDEVKLEMLVHMQMVKPLVKPKQVLEAKQLSQRE